jgi:phosphoglycerate kinase
LEAANTILAMKGMDIKKSIRDTDTKDVGQLKPLLHSPKVVLPKDFVWHDGIIWDIGQETVKVFSKNIAAARTILWSGPLGLIEKKKYTHGSIAVAKAIAKNRKAFSVAGGGETVMFLKQYKLDSKFSFISTGGGAMVDFLGGKKLPGIEALR